MTRLVKLRLKRCSEVLSGVEMQTLRDVRKRIGTIKGTTKIVGAMKMISAAKLKRAGQEVSGARL